MIKQNGMSNKPCLDQTSNHYKIVTTMFIHTWNEHLDIQANKLSANHLHAQHQSTVHKVYASWNKILLGHKSEST